MAQILSVNSKSGKDGDIKENLFATIWNWFSSKDTFTKLAIITILLLILITPYIIYERFDIRNRATGQQVAVYFVRSGGATPLSTLSLTRGETVDLKLYVDTAGQEINGFDISTIQSTSHITLSQPGVTEEAGAARFNTPLFNNYQNNTWRFAKVHTNTGDNISGTLHLATLRFTATQDGSGTIQMQPAEITSPQQDTLLPGSTLNITYTVVAPTNTPTPVPPTPTMTPTPIPTATPTPRPTSTPTPTNTPIPTATPTPRPTATPIPTATPTPRPTSTPIPTATPVPTSTPTPLPTATPIPIAADVDRNGCVGIVDFNLWLQAFTGNPAPNTYPDINSDGRITIQDFNVWFRTMRTGNNICP